MLVVAVVGLLLGGFSLMERARRFQAKRDYHASVIRSNTITYEMTWARWGYHYDMRAKYNTAAARPWLPVAPDPPEPK
jgi:hypothetical protein